MQRQARGCCPAAPPLWTPSSLGAATGRLQSFPRPPLSPARSNSGSRCQAARKAACARSPRPDPPGGCPPSGTAAGPPHGRKRRSAEAAAAPPVAGGGRSPALPELSASLSPSPSAGGKRNPRRPEPALTSALSVAAGRPAGGGKHRAPPAPPRLSPGARVGESRRVDPRGGGEDEPRTARSSRRPLPRTKLRRGRRCRHAAGLPAAAATAAGNRRLRSPPRSAAGERAPRRHGRLGPPLPAAAGSRAPGAAARSDGAPRRNRRCLPQRPGARSCSPAAAPAPHAPASAQQPPPAAPPLSRARLCRPSALSAAPPSPARGRWRRGRLGGGGGRRERGGDRPGARTRPPRARAPWAEPARIVPPRRYPGCVGVRASNGSGWGAVGPGASRCSLSRCSRARGRPSPRYPSGSRGLLVWAASSQSERRWAAPPAPAR